MLGLYLIAGSIWLGDLISASDRSVAVSVLTLQIAFAVYLIAVKKEENFDRLFPQMQEVLHIKGNEKELIDQARIYADWALGYSQRRTANILAVNLFICPFLLIHQEIVYRVIVLLSVWNTFGLSLSFILHRVELLKSPISATQAYIDKLTPKIKEYFKRNNTDLIAFLLIIIFFGALVASATNEKNKNEV